MGTGGRHQKYITKIFAIANDSQEGSCANDADKIFLIAHNLALSSYVNGTDCYSFHIHMCYTSPQYNEKYVRGRA